MIMDAETMLIAVEFGLNQTVCLVCHQPTLFRVNDRKSNIPMTCGAWACGVIAAETWAVER